VQISRVQYPAATDRPTKVGRLQQCNAEEPLRVMGFEGVGSFYLVP